ncbi:MAG: phage/plasmid primase, P4 family [Streptosporangiales bacterium]
MSELLDTALGLYDAGCCPIPAKADGSKAPFGSWKRYETTRPDRGQVEKWLSNGTYDGIGLICGAVSGNLEMFELEGRAIAEGYLQRLVGLLNDHGLAGLWQRLTAGYVEATPSGGLHVLYRVDGEPRRNTKLACRPAREDELDDDEREQLARYPNKVFRRVLVETRGEGGFVVVAPSAGRTHETGKAWTLIAGGPATIPMVSEEERDALHAVASMLDSMPAPEPPSTTAGSTADDDALRPGDDYNQRVDWLEILEPHGWRHTRTFGRTRGWCRPGKKGLAVSATTGRNDADNLYVFSTSAAPFEHETPYSKFAAYALLEYDGDYPAAARALRDQGYGGERPHDDAGIDNLIDHDGDDDGPGQQAPPAAHAGGAAYTTTDDGNARRLVDTHSDVIRHVPERGLWLSWTGSRWRWDLGGDIIEHARGIARSLPATDKESAKFKRASLSARGVNAMVQLARSDRRVRAHQHTLNARPYELNTPAGIVDLRTGQLLDPDPAALHTRCTTVAPDYDAVPHRWLRFLADTFAGEEDVTNYVRRLLGMALLGAVHESLLPFSWGSGANGKTTLFDVVMRVLGIGDDGYALSAPADLLLAKIYNDHPTEVARLSGARLVVCSELDDNQQFAEAKVKLLTGKDVITGRFMRQDFFSFRPTHTLFLLGNNKPAVRTGGPAFWRRIRLIPFLHTVPEKERDTKLADSLVNEEAPGILAWLISGAVGYLYNGLAEPESVRAATGSYEHDQDSLGRFVEECCIIGEPNRQDLRIQMSRLRDAYEKWCTDEGEFAINPKAFGQGLRSRYGVVDWRSHGRKFYCGIRLDETEDRAPGSGTRDSSGTRPEGGDGFDGLL